MDVKVLKELNDVVEKLTHSGDPTLDQTQMKRVKTLCKSSDLFVRTVFDLLVKHMSKKHSEIRLSSFQVCDELFRRSNTFRELMADNFHKIITLACGVESQSPLPPPKQAAERLKRESLLAIKNWMEKYGGGYPKLKLGYQYLKYNKKVDFDSLIAASEGELRQREERERRNRALLEQRLREVKTDFRDQLPEICVCVREMESCFQILMPAFDVQPESQTSDNNGKELSFVRLTSTGSSDSFVSIDSCNVNDDDDEDHDNGINDSIDEQKTADSLTHQNETKDDRSENQSDSDSDVEWEEVGMGMGLEVGNGDVAASDGFGAHGMIGTGWNVTFEVPDTVQVVEGEHNDTLVEVLRERHKTLTRKHLKSINRWIEWFTKGDEEALLKEAIDVKSLVMATCEKYSELNIVSKERDELDLQKEACSSSNTTQPLLSPTREKSGLFSSHEGTLDLIKNQLVHDPTTPQAQLVTVTSAAPGPEQNNNSSTAALRDMQPQATNNGTTPIVNEDVPVVPFDVDLINWSNTKGPAPTVASIGSLNQFWCEDKDIAISEDHKKGLRCRVISFPGEFEPITRTCRAPLGNGKLCPRQDRHKCPFHGPIIVRDEFGAPIPELSASASVTAAKKESDIAASSNEKKKKGKRKKTVKHPGLTDLKKLKETPQSRIEGKILNKRALKRIGQKMDSFERKLRKDKFADNFNYALKQ